MDELAPVMVIHFYDVRVRAILCGLRGYEHRSTKHARGVTCTACVALLQQGLPRDAAPDPDGGRGSMASA